jgi:hypothetical protein
MRSHPSRQTNARSRSFDSLCSLRMTGAPTCMLSRGVSIPALIPEAWESKMLCMLSQVSESRPCTRHSQLAAEEVSDPLIAIKLR